tara:strand:+ start:87 stop:200 length:114 start_codon:yes stop_codon:yes gene_type:complete
MTESDFAYFAAQMFGAYMIGWGTGFLWKFFHQLSEKI